jgi:uncharacterized membrane protein
MSDRVMVVVTMACALGCGVNAGVFFAFSSFVMHALSRLPPTQGVAAMQSINVVAVTPVFMTALFGTGAACRGLAGSTPFMWQRPGAGYVLAGTVIYLVGIVLVTIVFNVPRNDALAAVNVASPDAARAWSEFQSAWTKWNHVRTIAGLISAGLLTFALIHAAD